MILESEKIIMYMIIALGSGFIIGYLKVKMNQILIIITGKLRTNKQLRQRYIAFGVITSILFFILYYLFTPDPEITFGIIFSILYALTYTIGIVLAETRFEQSLTILEKIIYAMYTGSSEGNKITSDAFRIAKQILDNMPVSNKETFLLIILFFDSRFVVFLTSLFAERRFLLKRFIHMNEIEQDEYLKTWDTNSVLSPVLKALKSITSFPYYTSSLSWKKIGYEGSVLKESYLH